MKQIWDLFKIWISNKFTNYKLQTLAVPFYVEQFSIYKITIMLKYICLHVTSIHN